MKLRNVHCSHCYGLVPETAEECPDCGVPLMHWSFCMKCGFSSIRKLILCPRCGTFIFGGRPVAGFLFFLTLWTIVFLLAAVVRDWQVNYIWIILSAGGVLFLIHTFFDWHKGMRRDARMHQLRQRRAVRKQRR